MLVRLSAPKRGYSRRPQLQCCTTGVRILNGSESGPPPQTKKKLEMVLSRVNTRSLGTMKCSHTQEQLLGTQTLKQLENPTKSAGNQTNGKNSGALGQT